jgi:hypothetical protein
MEGWYMQHEGKTMRPLEEALISNIDGFRGEHRAKKKRSLWLR